MTGPISWALFASVFSAVQYVMWKVQKKLAPFEDPARLAWKKEHDALTRVLGEVLTPRLPGSAEDRGYRALPPASDG